MEIIIIENTEDNTSLPVVEWLIKFGLNYKYINFNEFGKTKDLNFFINNENNELFFDKNSKINSYLSIWFRSDSSSFKKYSWTENSLTKKLENYLLWEFETLKSSLYRSNGVTRWLSNYESTKLDKLKVLSLARKTGLDIPDSMVTTSKKALLDFSYKHGAIISKAAFENISYIKTTQGYLKNFVNKVDKATIDLLSDSFFPSFFQKLIPKEYDIRVFYLEGKLYSMAIFSLSVDYRADYDNHRNVPLKLPETLENQIRDLMNKLNLNTGSLDFVKSSEDGKFYFLEVNPNGQFGMVSEPCNYYIEREIAKFLCHEE